jgi:hypothetical protein
VRLSLPVNLRVVKCPSIRFEVVLKCDESTTRLGRPITLTISVDDKNFNDGDDVLIEVETELKRWIIIGKNRYRLMSPMKLQILPRSCGYLTLPTIHLYAKNGDRYCDVDRATIRMRSDPNEIVVEPADIWPAPIVSLLDK